MGETTAEFDDHLYTIPEAIEALRIGSSHFYKLMQTQVIRPLRLGSRTLIPRREISRLIREATGR
ncbi:helix-turn-helix domain-containing protein [Mycobacterium aquaticum]|uniref:Helix-turn-helix domain-containing protein n=1 Tax=Mycobacterium aquaticum TaxID=1927124 RepID=A0A1X0ABI7_9MYCO|nr:helix-turn-helix domain-containing protein [Mycobacterium aquaticum]ORA27404.1 hypothetical protein BST13_30580 [Mycobacterium aquaticum]